MTEQMPQSTVDGTFKDILSNGFPSATEDGLDADVVTLNELFLHLKGLGYSDDEITTIFDLASEGEKREV